MNTSTKHAPDGYPELVGLRFTADNPNDYQSTLTVPAGEYPVYAAAPQLAEVLKNLLPHVGPGYSAVVRLRLLQPALDALKAAGIQS